VKSVVEQNLPDGNTTRGPVPILTGFTPKCVEGGPNPLFRSGTSSNLPQGSIYPHSSWTCSDLSLPFGWLAWAWCGGRTADLTLGLPLYLSMKHLTSQPIPFTAIPSYNMGIYTSNESLAQRREETFGLRLWPHEPSGLPALVNASTRLG